MSWTVWRSSSPSSCVLVPSNASPARREHKTRRTRRPCVPGREATARGGQNLAKPLLKVIVLGVVILSMEFFERRLIAFVQQKQLALGEHLVDHRRERFPDRQVIGPSAICSAGLSQFVNAKVQRQEDVVLGHEVVVERRLGESQPLRDLPQRGPVEALLDERSSATSRMRSRVEPRRLVRAGLCLPAPRTPPQPVGPSFRVARVTSPSRVVLFYLTAGKRAPRYHSKDLTSRPVRTQPCRTT